MSKTTTHLAIQKQIQELIGKEKIALEKQVVRGRIADCVWLEEKIVFEVQVSSITREEVLARTRAYRDHGFDIVWILHESSFGNTCTSAEKALATVPHYYTNTNAEKMGIIYDRLFEKRVIKRSIISPIRLSQPMRSTAKEKTPLRAFWPVHFAQDYTLKREKQFFGSSWIKQATFFHNILLNEWVKKAR